MIYSKCVAYVHRICICTIQSICVYISIYIYIYIVYIHINQIYIYAYIYISHPWQIEQIIFQFDELFPVTIPVITNKRDLPESFGASGVNFLYKNGIKKWGHKWYTSENQRLGSPKIGSFWVDVSKKITTHP